MRTVISAESYKKDYPGSTLHQIGPYVGKMRPSLARKLVELYSKEGDWVWDPFCGSGTVPLEGKLLSRNVIAADTNPYACVLTRAKLHAPTSEDYPLEQLRFAENELKSYKSNGPSVPQWVSRFFHPRTLKEALFLTSRFIVRKQYFNLGCLLGILHHQRPGFLSYPASHLIPYLRDKLYPRDQYPEAYKYRDPIPRLEDKIKRMLFVPPQHSNGKFRVFQKSVFSQYLPDESIDTIITSPPYMDALDYSRDNRLRLWFLGFDYKQVKVNEIRRVRDFENDMTKALQRMVGVIKPGGGCVLVLGDVSHGNGKKYDVPQMIVDLVKRVIPFLRFEDRWIEDLPDSRRSVRNGRATKKESILVFRKKYRR